MITHYYNLEINILEVRYSGIITINDIIRYGESVESDKNLPRELRILTDVSEGEYHIKPTDLPNLLKELRKHVRTFSWMKAAFLQRNPKETALSYLMQKEIDIKNYYHKIFSTREAGVAWLLGDSFY